MVRDLKHALRSIRSRPALAGIIVLTLAIAIGVNTASFMLRKWRGMLWPGWNYC